MLEQFWLCFLSLFVAVDAFGTLPIFASLVEGLPPRNVRRVILQSLVTAALVAIAFMAVGNALIAFLGITTSDFLIAGGTVLFIISVSNLLAGGGKPQLRIDPDSLGAVPIGVPLIVGPAVLATLVLLLGRYKSFPTVALALILNISIAGGVYSLARPLNRALGKAGSKALSKLASLVLAAYGVMLIREGITGLLQTLHDLT